MLNKITNKLKSIAYNAYNLAGMAFSFEYSTTQAYYMVRRVSSVFKNYKILGASYSNFLVLFGAGLNLVAEYTYADQCIHHFKMLFNKNYKSKFTGAEESNAKSKFGKFLSAIFLDLPRVLIHSREALLALRDINILIDYGAANKNDESKTSLFTYYLFNHFMLIMSLEGITRICSKYFIKEKQSPEQVISQINSDEPNKKSKAGKKFKEVKQIHVTKEYIEKPKEEVTKTENSNKLPITPTLRLSGDSFVNPYGVYRGMVKSSSVENLYAR